MQNRVISADVLLRASAIHVSVDGKSNQPMEHGYTGKTGTVGTREGVTNPEFAAQSLHSVKRDT